MKNKDIVYKYEIKKLDLSEGHGYEIYYPEAQVIAWAKTYDQVLVKGYETLQAALEIRKKNLGDEYDE